MLDLPPLMDDMREHEKHGHVGGEHVHDEAAGDTELREGPLDLAAVRAKLQSKTGKQYWRTLEELVGDPQSRISATGAFRMGRRRRPARFPEADGGIAGICGPFRVRPHS